MLTALAGEGIPRPAVPPLAQSQPGELSHQVEFRRPHIPEGNRSVLAAAVACSVSTLRFDIVEVPSGKLLGIRVTQRTSLAARDSRTWKHTISLYPTSASGAARGVTANLKLNCGKSAKTKCAVTSAPGTKGLSLKKETSFPFALKSPGSATLKHRETPVVTLKAAVGSPATGSLVQAATVRCDSVKGITTKAGGCVHPGAVPVFSMSRSDKTVKEAAQHVWDAQRKLKGHPGRLGVGKPLHRTTDKKLIDKNRSKACRRACRVPRARAVTSTRSRRPRRAGPPVSSAAG